VAHGPARPEELDETTDYENQDFNELVNAYITRSDSLAEQLLGPEDEDTYPATAGIRRTLALVGGDFLAAQMIAGLAVDPTLIVGVLEEEFARPFGLYNSFGLNRSIELLGQTVLVDGLPRVSAALRGLEQIGAAGAEVSKDDLIDTADLVVDDVFGQGADLTSDAFHAAVPGVSLISGGKTLIQLFPMITQRLDGARGWLAKAAQRLLEAARQKIISVLDRVRVGVPGPLGPILAEQKDNLLDQLRDFPTDHLIESVLRRFYNLDELGWRCKQKIDALDDIGRAAAYEQLQLIPEHAKSWLRWGSFGVGALNMAAPLLHGSGAGVTVHIAVGALIVVYALWVTHDHLDSPSWWQSLPRSRGVLTVL
jgi:hypothetical protein